MKIERINENQIRCTLSSFDLSVRNLNLGELAYGSEKARSLFREMIQKASNEVGFEADDIPLMVEAIPLSSESVMLVITKIEDPEELDTRFAKFSPGFDDDSDIFLSDMTNEILEGADDLTEFLQYKASKEPEGLPEEGMDGTDDKESKETKTRLSARIYLFDSLDRISEAARALGQVYHGENTLYKKPDTRQYFLVIKQVPGNTLEFSKACNILSEYGSKIPYEYASESYYLEHYEVIISLHALQTLTLI